MRSRITSCALAVIACCFVLANAYSAEAPRQGTEKAPAKPKLVMVSMYTWALGTGRIRVDLKGCTLQALGFITREPTDDLTEKDKEDIKAKKAQRGWPMVEAEIATSEIEALRKMVGRSDLRGFRPDKSYIKDRRPYPDESTPDLVLTWDDRRDSYKLPLEITLRSDAPRAEKARYKAVEDICAFLFHLEREYRRPQNYSVVLMDSPTMKQYVRDRETISPSSAP